MWSGPIHDREFISDVLSHVEENEDKYGTSARMKGMLTVAKEVCKRYVQPDAYSPRNQELDIPFYFTPSKIASHFHCICPSLDETAYNSCR